MKLTLQNQILIALLFLTLIFASIVGLNYFQFEKNQEFQNNLFVTKSVTERSVDLANRAIKYGEVAPRDFPAYNRDVQLFYPNLQNELKELDSAIDSLSAINANRKEIEKLQSFYQTFSQGLWEKLGDKDQPRLEWGADYLAEQAPLLRDHAQSFEKMISASTAKQLNVSKSLSRFSWVTGLIAIFAILFWFWKKVTSRIKNAAESCLKVAKGEFGTRIDDSSKDEIGAFSGAFNSLSARTRVVLGVIDKLPPDPDTSQAFTTIWEESHEYLGHQWQGLFALDDQAQKAKFLTARQHSAGAFQMPSATFKVNDIVKSSELKEKSYAYWPNIRKHTLNIDEAKLLRELSRRGLSSLAMVMLKNDQSTSNRGDLLMVFAWSEENSEQIGVASFLGSLSKFLKKSLL